MNLEETTLYCFSTVFLRSSVSHMQSYCLVAQTGPGAHTLRHTGETDLYFIVFTSAASLSSFVTKIKSLIIYNGFIIYVSNLK